jgi:uncharacterized protein YcfJ
MARSHHRKKHKEHLKHFKSAQQDMSGVSPSNRVSGTWMFGIAGLIVGLAIGYFATSGSILWIAVGAIAGTAAGYFIGKKIDSGKV